jgi:hypothetical protein
MLAGNSYQLRKMVSVFNDVFFRSHLLLRGNKTNYLKTLADLAKDLESSIFRLSKVFFYMP